MVKQQIISHLEGDAILRPLIRRIPFPNILPSNDNLEHDLIKAIIYQQLSTSAANTIYQRFLKLLPDKKLDGRAIQYMTDDDMRSAGVSRQKAAYIRNIALFFEDPEHKNRHWENLDDESLIKKLTSIKGVGVWTVKMVMISNMARPDIFAPEDLGVKNAMIELYELKSEKRALTNDLYTIAEAWRPYRTYACHYLWRWKDE